MSGEVPKEKLRAEIAAPYKQVKERQKQVLHVSALSLFLTINQENSPQSSGESRPTD